MSSQLQPLSSITSFIGIRTRPDTHECFQAVPMLLQVNPNALRLCKSSPVINMGVVGAKLLLHHPFMLVTSGYDLTLIPYDASGFLPLNIFTTLGHRILDAYFDEISKQWVLVSFARHDAHMTLGYDLGLHL
jgi:hypothetical protein